MPYCRGWTRVSLTRSSAVADWGEPMSDWQRAVDVAYQDPRVAGAAPYIEIQAMISGPRVQGALVHGVDPAMEVVTVQRACSSTPRRYRPRSGRGWGVPSDRARD